MLLTDHACLLLYSSGALTDDTSQSAHCCPSSVPSVNKARARTSLPQSREKLELTVMLDVTRMSRTKKRNKAGTPL